MSRTEETLGQLSIGKLLLKYSIPAIIGMMVNALYNIVDRIFIGNIPGVGSLAITGLGITMPIITILLAFSMLIGIGATTNISIKLGQDKKEEAERIIGNAITLSLVVGIILTVVGLFFEDSILKAFGASNETLYYAKSYVNIILFGSVFSIMAFVLNSTIRGDGNPRLSATIMIVGCLINIVLDALFIFVFNMGIQGAAIATVISQMVTAVCGILYYVRGNSNLVFKVANLKLDKNIIKTIFSIGLSPFSMQLATSLVQVINNNALRTYGGDLAIGAMAAISSIMMVFLMPTFGIVQGAQPIIGFNYGKKQYDRAKKTYRLSVIASTIIFLVGAFIIQVFPEAVVGLFNKGDKLMEISVKGIRIYGLFLPLVSTSIVGSNYMQSIGKAKVSIFLSLLRQVILLVPMIIVLPNYFGLNGVWLAQPVSDIIAVAITALVVEREFKSYKTID